MSRPRKTIGRIFLALALSGFSSSLFAVNYYVDVNHPSASDANPGTITLPFKTIQKGANAADPGDAVLIREGVYRETGFLHGTRGPMTVYLQKSGLPGLPITFKAFDGETPILDGSSEPLVTWTQCSPGLYRCDQIPNHSGVYVTAAPSEKRATSSLLYEGDELLYVAQDPDPVDKFYYEDPATWPVVPEPYFTTSSIADPARFNNPDPSYWVNGYVMIWTGNNNVEHKKILTYEPALGRLTFEPFSFGSEFLEIGKDAYAVWNHPEVLNQPGEYVIDEEADLLYVRPINPANLNQIKFAEKTYGIALNYQSHIVIDGLTFRGYEDDAVTNFLTGNSQGSNLIIKNSEFYNTKADGIGVSRYDFVEIKNNYVHDNFGAGIFVSQSSSVTLANNRVERTFETSLRFYTVSNGTLRDNVVRDSHGQHGNGITCYLNCENILIEGNRIINSNISITHSTSRNIIIRRNILDSRGYGPNIAGWGGEWIPGVQTSGIVIENNTMLNGRGGVDIVNSSALGTIIRNNILSGIPLLSAPNPVTHSNNLYLNLAFTTADLFGTVSKPNAAGLASANSSFEPDLNKIFVDPAGGNFELKPGVRLGIPDVDPWTMSTTGDQVGAFGLPEETDFGDEDEGDNSDDSGDSNDDGTSSSSPTQFESFANSFNPAKGQSLPISFSLKNTGGVSLKVFDRGGREVKTIFSGSLSAGSQTVDWDGKNSDGQTVVSGIYLLLLEADGETATTKIAVIK